MSSRLFVVLLYNFRWKRMMKPVNSSDSQKYAELISEQIKCRLCRLNSLKVRLWFRTNQVSSWDVQPITEWFVNVPTNNSKAYFCFNQSTYGNFSIHGKCLKLDQAFRCGCVSDGFASTMVFFRGKNTKFPLPPVRGNNRRQRGILPPAGRQLYSGYGPAVTSVSGLQNFCLISHYFGSFLLY